MRGDGVGKHKRRRERETLPPLRLLPKAPTAPPKTTLNTCAITGERLTLSGARVTVADNDRIILPKRPDGPHDLNPHSTFALGYRVSLPYRTHQRMVEGRLGGNAFAGPIIKYFDAGTQPPKPQPYHRERLSDADYAYRFWWTPTWAERELRAHFPADAVDVVLSVCRDGQSWDEAMIGSERAMADVGAMKTKMKQHCQAVLREMWTQAA